MSFLERFRFLSKRKNTILCVGLDPALPKQRTENVLPENYTELDENEARLRFCFDIVKQVSDYCIAIKPNQQYLIGFTKNQHQQLTEVIREHNMLSILDYKLNDIGETIKSGIFHLIESGYDAITFNPLPGNLKEAVYYGHKYGEKLRDYELGIIVLTLMSNPEAAKYMKEAKISGQSLYLAIAEDVKKHNADGCVVGATGHITEENIKEIRSAAGKDKIFLVPGVGAQKGNPAKVIRAAGKTNIILNVGRDIIYSRNPRERALSYFELFSRLRL